MLLIFVSCGTFHDIKEYRDRIFSQAGNELGASSITARNELFLKLAKNTASDFHLYLRWLRSKYYIPLIKRITKEKCMCIFPCLS